ncbi:MAG: LON peptidase substrate-binding domain-containing protein, partial [Verrucomicrobiae bacterium]|nr:LON peptidase substrate-binding domain-containing protein [Verrucomicrobiae bacterium]
MNSPDTEFIRIAGLPDRDANESSPRPADSSLPSALPVLGLSDIVVFPGMVVPLLVESAPSIRLIDDVVAGDRLVCLVLQRKPDTTDPRPDELFEVGCASRVLRMLKFPDNTVRILIEGLHRVRLKDFLSRDPYLRAECEPVTVAPEDTMEIAALVRNIRSKFEEISELSPALTEQVRVAALNVEEPGKLADLIAGNVNLSLDERQTLLETPRLLDRLNRLLPLLAREAELLALGSKIQNEVTSSVNRNQREFFLREQMRAIQRELGEGEGAGS